MQSGDAHRVAQRGTCASSVSGTIDASGAGHGADDAGDGDAADDFGDGL